MAQSASVPQSDKLRNAFIEATREFESDQSLTPKERDAFKGTTFENLVQTVNKIQKEQEAKRHLSNMRRLEPFLKSTIEFGAVAETLVNFSNFGAVIWGPIKYILLVSHNFNKGLNSILDAWQQIGEQLPLFKTYHELFESSAYMQDILVMVFRDILDLHRRSLKYFRGKVWHHVFGAAWKNGFVHDIQHIKENMGRHKRLVESRATLVDFEKMRNLRTSASQEFEAAEEQREHMRRTVVRQWLNPFSCEAEQDRLREVRSVCSDPGRWLLEDAQFKTWIDPTCPESLLWLKGIPGSGKTVLASVVIDEVQKLPGAVVYFYFKHGLVDRNTFLAAARSILAQLLAQKLNMATLLPYLHDKASFSSSTVLASPSVAKEMMQTAMSTCPTTLYVVLDGLDECLRKDQKEISSWFLEMTCSPLLTQRDSIRCLFVSQDDSMGLKGLESLPTIDMTASNNLNRKDIESFMGVKQTELEKEIGTLGESLSSKVVARAGGMFIFAKLMADYLQTLPSRAEVLRALDPSQCPVDLDAVYERVLDKILEDGQAGRVDARARKIRQVLGWIVCAKRSIRWREIQGAICIDVENEGFNQGDKLRYTPRELFASLVEVWSDDTVELVHGTAREYLLKRKVGNVKFVEPRDVDYYLSIVCLTYLAFPSISKTRDEEFKQDLIDGDWAFYDYASACWSLHLESGVPPKEDEEKCEIMRWRLKEFVEIHWSDQSKVIAVRGKIQQKIGHVVDAEMEGKVLQAVAWSQNHVSGYGDGPTEDDALDLWEVTKKVRSVLEEMAQTDIRPEDKQALQSFYGPNWFKCPRINCFYYHTGFSTNTERDLHVSRHERPFLCTVLGCSMARFGCVTKDQLEQHLFETHGIDIMSASDFSDLMPSSTSVTKAKVLMCPECDKRFGSAVGFEIHMRGHKDETPFTCDVCNKGFSSKGVRDRHEESHGDRSFPCSGVLADGTKWGCGASFRRADKLFSHFRTEKGRACVSKFVQEKREQVRQLLEKAEPNAQQEIKRLKAPSEKETEVKLRKQRKRLFSEAFPEAESTPASRYAAKLLKKENADIM